MTKTLLANIALGKLGASRITSLDERSPVAEKLREMWDVTRDSILRRREWNFALKRVTLSALATAPAFGYAYQYQLPTDYIRAVEFNAQAAGTSQALFEIEGDKLLTNDETAELRYVYRNEDVSSWDDGFHAAFAFALAAAVAPSLSNSQTMAADLEAKAERAITKAGGANLGEDKPRAILAFQDSGYINARLGAQNW